MATSNPLPNPGSSSVNPDLNWSQIRETISLLCLAMAQVETTLNDSSKDVSKLTSAFTHIASDAQKLGAACRKLESPGDFAPAKSEITSLASAISQEMGMAIVAFQFYDRLSQRLDHVKRDLGWLSNLVSDPQQLYNPLAWSKLQEDIMSNYTMEEERIMFQHIMKGASVEEALEIYQHHFRSKKEEGDITNDEIELF